jgi:hypothetical protein
MSTQRPYFDLKTPDYYTSFPPRPVPLRSLFTRTHRASSLPRFVVGSAPAARIDQPRQRASTPSASPASAEPPPFFNVATPAPTPTSPSQQSSRRSASPSRATPFTGLPALNLDATASSWDPDSSWTTSHRLSHRNNNTDARLTFRLHEQLRFVFAVTNDHCDSTFVLLFDATVLSDLRDHSLPTGRTFVDRSRYLCFRTVSQTRRCHRST